MENSKTEIYAGSMSDFFKKICANGEYFAELGYQKNDRMEGLVEIWTIDEKTLNYMSNMSEEEFLDLAGEDAWWRWSDGSILGTPSKIITVNGEKMYGWHNDWNYEDDECEPKSNFSCLSEYLCDEIGASQPKNVCALSVDLAKGNHITMVELFQIYEGDIKSVERSVL